MKKILIALDGAHFSESAMAFATRLNETFSILLVGVFLSPIDYSDVLRYYMGGLAGPFTVSEVTNDAGLIEENVKKFQSYCQKNTIEYRIHYAYDDHIWNILKKESRYSDLLIIGSELFYENLGASNQKAYLKESLHKIECPVLLIPESYQYPENAIIAYDGSASAMFALKQFAYLFPQFSNLDVMILYVHPDNADLPDMSYLEELAPRHFKKLTYLKLDLNPQKHFNTWITDRKNTFLVCGSFGRSGFSEMLKKNFTWNIIEDHRFPIFIAHP